MLTKELKQLGQKISQELDDERSSVTQKWMSHYIAELMIRAESHENEEIRIEAAKTCSDLILNLWNFQKDRIRVQTQTSIYARFELSADRRLIDNELIGAIQNPDVINNMENQVSKDMILISLDSLEIDLIRMRVIGNELGNIPDDMKLEDVFKDDGRIVRWFEILVENVQKIWPEAEEISIANLAMINDFVALQLDHIQLLRRKLLDI